MKTLSKPPRGAEESHRERKWRESITRQVALTENPSVGIVVTTSSDLVIANNVGTVLVDALASNLTMTLPVASEVSGQVINIKKIDASANEVIIIGGNAEEIDGEVDLRIIRQHDCADLQSNGNEWFII